MNLIPDTFSQPDGEARRWMPLMKITVWIILVIVAVSAIVYYEVWSRTGNVGGVTPAGSNLQQATTTIIVSPAEKEKLLNQMSQLISATGTQTSSRTGTVPAPVTPPAEKQKLFDAMQQKVK